MNFHPDSNLPGCMMPDGGECCVGHAAVVEDWHKQRQEIERLREALSLLWIEVVASGNSGARDYGWQKACAATSKVLGYQS